MSTSWKTVRVFISSTFHDMHAERDYLVNNVFLELRERCAKRRLHLIDVDLRWGVTEEEKAQGRVIEICLDEIERCRPFFIGLLGERYGKPIIYDATDDGRYKWVSEFHKTGTAPSLTALEIYSGVLRDRSMRSRAYFYFRDPSFLTDSIFLRDVIAQKKKDFLPEDELAASKLRLLKEEIKKHCPVFENYPCIYAGLDQKGRVKLGGFETLGKRILEDLWGAITLEYPEALSDPDDLSPERSYHETFIESRAQRFVGREAILAQLTAFAENEDESTLIVVGKSGCGKSAVLANLVKDYTARHPEEFVLAHFIGVSPGSTDVRRMLLRLCRELARRLNIHDEIPTDYYTLRKTFLGFLKQAAKQGKVLFVIDALNQFDEGHYAHALDWLPKSLPPGVKILASTVEESDCLHAWRHWELGSREIVLGALSESERKAIVRHILELYRKRLDDRPNNDQMRLLLSKTDSDTPLYLTVACEEMRVFGEFDQIAERIKALPNTVEMLFEQVLQRIEDDQESFDTTQGRDLVKRALSLLACSRRGLLESELLELLGSEDERLPQAKWARLYRSLRFYLSPSGSDESDGESEEGLLDFFHQQLSRAVRQKYLKHNDEIIATHGRLAKYFARKTDPEDNRTWSGNYPRGLSELPHQLLSAQSHDELFLLGRDELFLQRQAEAFEDPQVQLDTLQAAMTAAIRIEDAPRIAESILSHARRLVSIDETSPLEAQQLGRFEQAAKLAGLSFSKDKEKGVLWFLLVAWKLKFDNRWDDAQRTLIALVAKDLPRLEDNDTSLQTLVVIALAHAHEIDEPSFLTLQEKLLQPGGRVKLCQELLLRRSSNGNYSNRQQLMVAFQIANEVDDEFSKACILAEIAKAQFADGQCSEGTMTFATAIKTAKTINGRGVGYEAWALSEIAKAQAASEQFEEAIATALEINDSFRRAGALSDIGRAQIDVHKVNEGRQTLAEAIRTARSKGRWDNPAQALREVAVAQAAAGLVGEALETAKEIENENRGKSESEYDFDRSEALRAIVTAQANSGQFEDAKSTAREISDESGLVLALREIAKAQALKGDQVASHTFGEAIRLAADLQDSVFRGSGLREIVKAQLAARHFEDALKTAEGIRDEGYRADALMEIAKAQAEDGKIDDIGRTLREAFVLSERLPEFHRWEAVREIAKAHAAVGRFEDAIRTAREIAEGQYRVEALIEIAKAQSAVGRIQEAEQVFAEALTAAMNSAESYEKIATAQAIVGNVEAALWLTKQTIADPYSRAYRLREIANALVTAGRTTDADKIFEEAIVTAREIISADKRAESFGGISYAQAEAGKTEEAIKTAMEIGLEVLQVARGSRIAGALSRAGRFEEALDAIMQIDDRYRASALCELAQAKARAGRLEDAFETAGKIDDEFMIEEAQAVILKSQAEAGGDDVAIDAARQIDNHYRRAAILKEIANSQVSRGKLEAAAETFEEAILAANLISFQNSKDRTLTEIAEAQAAAGLEEAIKTTGPLAYQAYAISQVAEVFLLKGAKEKFMKALVPGSYHLASTYRMCGLLARLCAEDRDATNRIVALVLS